MKTHEVRMSPQDFKAIESGMKTWDLRYKDCKDRDYRVGEKLTIREWEGGYTGRRLTRLISGITADIKALTPGWLILSLTESNRSRRQNNYYWSQMELLARVMPEVERTSAGWHELLKTQVLGVEDIHLNGQVIPFSTAWLSVGQFARYLRQANDWVLRWYGIEFEDSVIYKYREWKDGYGKDEAQVGVGIEGNG